jgi:hypothetical protein
MALLEYDDSEALGTVRAVDTATVAVKVDNIDLLRKLQVKSPCRPPKLQAWTAPCRGCAEDNSRCRDGCSSW